MALKIKIVGPTKNLDPGFVTKINSLGDALGGTQLRITSGYRDPATNTRVGGVPRSNHLTGHAVDAYITIGGKEIPFGTAALKLAAKYGLRSGDVPGFYNGAPDTVHVDDAYNQGPGADTKSQTVATTRQPASTTINMPPALASAIQIAAAKFGVPASVLAGIWVRETGSKFPNPYANGLGYGGLFGTSVSKPFGSASDVRRVPVPTTQAQANLAAGILARLIREKGNLGAALLAYSGGGYSSVSGGTVSADAPAGGSGAGAGGTGGSGIGTYTISDYNGPDIAGSAATGKYPAGYGGTDVATTTPAKPLSIYQRAAQAYIQAMKGPMTKTLGRTRDPFGGERSPKIVPPSKKTAAPTMIGGYGTDLATLMTQASAQAVTNAKAAIAAEVEAYRQQQALDTQRTQSQTAAILAAQESAAKYLTGFGQVADQQYAQAQGSAEGFARGYGNQLASAVDASTAQMNRDLAAAGSPQVLPSQGATLGDVLYGTQGAIPSRLLGTQASAAEKEALNAPFSAVLTGDAARTATLGAANDRAAQYDAQIAAAEGKLPATISSFQKDAISNAISLASLNKPIITKDGLGRIIAINPLTGAVSNLGGGTLGAGGVAGIVGKPMRFGNQLIGFDAKGNPQVLFTGNTPEKLYSIGGNLVDANGKVRYRGTPTGGITLGKDYYVPNPDQRPGQPMYIRAIKGAETKPQLIRDAATGYTALFYPDRGQLIVKNPGTLPVADRPTLKQAADGSWVLWDPVTQTQLDPGGKLGTAKVTPPASLQVGVDAQGYKIEYHPDIQRWVRSMDPSGNWIKVPKTGTTTVGPGSKSWQSSIGTASRYAKDFASTKSSQPVLSSGKSVRIHDVYPNITGDAGNKIYKVGGKGATPFENAFAALVALNDNPQWPMKAFQILTARKAYSGMWYPDALSALAQEVGTAKAEKFLQTLPPYNQEGKTGRPFTNMKAAKSAAITDLAGARRSGTIRANAVQDLVDTGVMPRSVIEAAANIVYGASGIKNGNRMVQTPSGKMTLRNAVALARSGNAAMIAWIRKNKDPEIANIDLGTPGGTASSGGTSLATRASDAASWAWAGDQSIWPFNRG